MIYYNVIINVLKVIYLLLLINKYFKENNLNVKVMSKYTQFSNY